MQDNKDIHGAAKTGLKWLLSTTLVWQVASWSLTLLTARMLAPSEFGIVSMSETIAPYLLLVSCFGVDGWLLQRRPLSETDEHTAFTLNVVLGAGMMLFAFLAAPLLAGFYSEPRVEATFRFTSVVCLLRAIQVVSESRLRREFKFKVLSLMNLTIGIGRGVLQLILVFLGFSYWSLVIGGVVKEVAFVATYLYLRPVPLRFHWDTKLAKQIFKFGLHSSGAAALWIIFSTADNVIIGRLFGNEYLGLYAMAFFLSELPLSKINQIITPLVMPYYSGLANDISELKEAFLRTNRLVVTLVVPPLFGLAVTADEFIHLVLGEKWISMSPMLKVLCFVGVFRSIVGNTSPLFNAISSPQKSFYAALAPSLVLPPAFYFFGSSMGISGIYVVWLIIYPIAGLYVALKLVESAIGVSPIKYMSSIRAPIITSAFMAACCFFGASYLPLQSIVAILIAKIVIGVSVWIIFYSLVFPNQLKKDLSLFRGLVART